MLSASSCMRLTVRQGGGYGCYVILLQDLSCCNVWFGSKNKKGEFKGLWDAEYFIVSGCEAS